MGIDIDPDWDEHGVRCHDCFAVDETPKHMFMTVTGIKIGDGHLPGDPSCPNGMIALTQRVGHPCDWTAANANWYWEYWARSVGSAIYIVNWPYGIWAFSADGLGGCVTGATNQQANGPLVKWYGGSAQVAWTPDGGALCLPDVADLLNVTRTPNVNMDFWHEDDTYVGTRIVKKSEQTNVLIKYDHTL